MYIAGNAHIISLVLSFALTLYFSAQQTQNFQKLVVCSILKTGLNGLNTYSVYLLAYSFRAVTMKACAVYMAVVSMNQVLFFLHICQCTTENQTGLILPHAESHMHACLMLQASSTLTLFTRGVVRTC